MAENESKNTSKKTTMGSVITELRGNVPITGSRADSGTSIYTPAGNYIGGGSAKNTALENLARGASATNPSARVGDYVYSGYGKWTVVPNSETDIKQRLYVLHGGANKKNGVSFGDVVGAATSTIAEGWMANSVAKHIPVVGQIYELFSTALMGERFANKLQDAESKYLDEYLNQEVDYDIAADRIVNEDGTVTWKVNYDKMKDAGYGSGSDIKKYTDTTNTKAMLLGNGSIRLDVSPVFAASDRYNELVDRLNEQFPNGITREDADEVVDEETGDTMLDKINQAVRSEEDQFYYNAATFSRLKQVAPNASDEALQEAADTQLIGKFDVKTLEKNDVEVTIYTTDNTKEKVNAKTYLDGIKNMSKGERDDYMSSISNRIQSNDISDDEKAVLQAQANALYAASHNDGEYHGIYERDFLDVISDCPYRILPRAGEAWNFFVSVVETPLKWFGVDTSGGEEALMNKRLETFYDDEIIAPLVRGAMTLYNARQISKDTQQIEELIRGGASKIIGNSAKSAKWLPSFIAQVSSDLPIELARAMTYGAAGEDFNFWDEMTQDLVADAIFSTKGRRSVVEALNMPKYEYRRYRRGTDTSVKYEADEADLKADEIRDNNAKDIYDDEFDDGDLYPTGTGIREDAGLVEITANELATRRAETLMKHSNKVTLKVMELFFDKNAAQARIAIAIKANGGSTDDFRKALFYAGDIREVSKAMMSEFTRFSSVKTDYKEMGEKILNAVGDKKDFTQDDINYINASANRHRFLAENKGDKDAEDYIHKTYDPYINKVDPERAKELDDVMASYRKMASNVLDFYVEKGLISKEEAKRMRNSPAYKGGMFMPVWSKGAGLNGKWGKEIGQGRTKNKKVFNKEELIAVEDLEHPFTSLTQYIDNAMRNVAINEKAMFFRDMAAKYPGMDIRLYSDTGGALSEVENLKEINKDFAKKYDDIVAVVKQEYPSHQKWMTMNGDLVMKSKALSTTEDLKKLKQETTNLRAKQTRMRKAQDAYLKGNAIGKEDMTKLNNDIKAQKKVVSDVEAEVAKANKELDDEIESQRAQVARSQEEVDRLKTKETDIKAVSELNYDARKELAEKVVRNNQREDGYGSKYTILYRVQGGKPDKWRPNNRNTGFPGEFKSYGGQWDGAVWLTADKEWAENPKSRASAGVNTEFNSGRGENVTNENIVVIPVKNEDILFFNHETGSKAALDESGKKIVKTRGINNGMKKSEFILWENEHPEIFEDGHKAMLEELNKQREFENKRALRRAEDTLASDKKLLSDLESNKNSNTELNNKLAAEKQKLADLEERKTALKDSAIGKQPNLQKLQGSLDKAQERYDKAAERIKKASEAVRNADDSISIEERTKIANEYTKAEENFNKAEKSLQKAENKLAEAIKTGNFQHEFTSEKEIELELDPEVTKALKKTRKKYASVGDMLDGGVDALEAKGGMIDVILRDTIEETVYESIENGTRGAVGDPADEATRVVEKINLEAQANIDRRVLGSEKALTNDEIDKVTREEYEKAINENLNDAEKESLLNAANDLRKTERKKVLTSRNNALAMFEEAKKMAYEYGISGIMSVQEGKFTGKNEDAQAYYTSAPNDAKGVLDSKGNVVYYTPDNAVIRLSLHNLNDVDVMKSVIIHEYAHAAFDRAANRVPILNSLLQKMGYNVEVSEAVANSRDATELIAYITESRFLKDLDKWDAEYFGNDSVVQEHLNQMMKNLDVKDEAVFKDGFIKMMKVAVTYVKGKLTGMLSKVTTFDEFYSGLVNGDFADEMRINTAGTEWSNTGALRNYVEGDGNILEIDHSMNVKWDKIDIPGLKMAEDIQKVQDQIDANGVKEAEMLDRIKNEAAELIEEARKLSKGAPVELDTDSFIDVQLTNALKEAMKRNNDIGQVQNVLNEIVQAANPYVSRNSVIKVRTAEAAKKFRKNLHAHIKFKEMQGKKKKLSSDHINAVADKVADAVTEKVVGKRAKVSAINDAELTRILNEGGDGHTIRYLVDGKEQRYTFTGKGSEEFVKEFYSPEFVIKGPIKQKLLNAARFIANKKRELTTSFDPTRVLPNIARDWTRGIVTTGGEIILSPDDLRTEALERWNGVPEAQEKINNGFKLAQENQEGTTFTKSMETPKKNRPKAMVKALRAENGNAYTRYRAKTTDEKLSMLQDMGESLTRNRAMTNAYYDELIKASARGEKIDVAIEKAVNAAYFYGREATTNFFRRGKLIATVAQNVPYLSQKFASLESFTYAYLDNPIAVGRALKATVGAYSALIALALSNDESRKKYYLLTEYDRSNNIIIPLTNDMIMTIPLDENIAAFLTPYRRMIESLNGVDPEAFYLWGADFLAALSPLDLTGFSEGDGFNVVRGLQKLGSEIIPTWALPILESWTGTDWYYGTDIRVDEEYVGARTGNYTPTPGELTTKSNNSKTLAAVSDGTGIPQWILQRFMQQYGGNVGQYVINGIDKLTGATQEEQGGKDFVDAIFKPFTGMDSDNASQAFWNGVNQIEDRKKKLQNELRTLKGKIESSAGEEKAKLQKERQEKIAKYGTDITDFIDQYLSAYEITGGLTKQQANRVWRLYSIYDQDKNQSLYNSGSVEEYFADKAQKSANKKANNLAARSGIDKYYVSNGLTDYDTSYAMKSLKDTIYGVPTQQMVDIANILENTEDYDNSFTKMRSDVRKARSKLYDEQRWDERDKLAYQYDYKILQAIYPYLLEHGVAETLNNETVIDYLEDWIIVPSEEQKTAKGKYVPNLGKDAQKEKAFKKQFIKKMLGVAGE